jgi:hypothetical protein
MRKPYFILTGCLWLLSFVLLLPGIWISVLQGYGIEEFLLLIMYPDDSEENWIWFYRILLFSVFLITSGILLSLIVRTIVRSQFRGNNT